MSPPSSVPGYERPCNDLIQDLKPGLTNLENKENRNRTLKENKQPNRSDKRVRKPGLVPKLYQRWSYNFREES
jgi:hypothetical protein